MKLFFRYSSPHELQVSRKARIVVQQRERSILSLLSGLVIL